MLALRCRLRRRSAAGRAGRRSAGRDRGPGAADRGVRAPRSDAPAVRAAGVPRRPGAHLAVQAFRRHLGPARAARRRAASSRSPTRAGGCAGASSTTARGRPASPTPRWRRCSAPTAARSRRAAGTTPRRSPRTAARSMSASSASTGSCASTTARTACARARQPIEVPAGVRSLPNNSGIEALVFVPRGLPLAGTLIAISERGLDQAGNHPRLPDRRADARRLHGQAHRRLRHQRRRAAAGRRSAAAGAQVQLDRRAVRSASGASRWRSIEPGALVDGPVLFEADLGYADRQHGRAERAPRRGRRDRAHADFGRQFLDASSARCCCSSRWRGP